MIGHLRTMLRLLTAELLSLAAVACTLRIPEGYDPDVSLSFDPVMYSAVKAGPGAYPDGLDFCAYLWDYAAADSPAAAQPYLSGAHVHRTDGAWVPVPTALWPARDRRVSVIACSPYGRAASVSLDGGVCFPDVDTEADQTDLLYTDRQDGLSKTTEGGVINLPFRHALCLVDFGIRSNASEGETAIVRSITLRGVRCQGSFSSSSEPEWTLTGDARDIPFFEGEQELTRSNEYLGDSRWIIPQRLSLRIDAQLTVKDANGTVTDLSFSSEPRSFLLGQGRHYTFTLSCLLDTETLKIDIIDNLL